MKRKLMLVSLALIMGLAFAMPGQALEVKAVVPYNLDSNVGEEAIGCAVVKDLIIDGIDIDLLIASERGTMLNCDEKTLLTGISYNKSLTEKLGLTAGIGLGFKDFLDLTQIRHDDNIEIDRYIYGGISLKF